MFALASAVVATPPSISSDAPASPYQSALLRRNFLRASGLYSFAQKPENQAVFGLYPYRNEAMSSDAGGYFKDTYTTIKDEFVLKNALKDGWFSMDGGFAYYVEGKRLYGIELVDGYYYDFGEKGINVGQTKYSGLFVKNENTYFARNGELVKGWQSIGDDWYLFNWSTGVGVDGTHRETINGVAVTYEMDNGRLVKGFWHEDEIGLRYFYGPWYYAQGWKTIDGEQYFFEEYYAKTGVKPVRPAHATFRTWYEFAENGALIGEAEDGLYWFEDKLYYVVDTLDQHTGLYCIDGDYYYFSSSYNAHVNRVGWISNMNGLPFPAGTYRFAADGKIMMEAEVVNENGVYYYYNEGRRVDNAGLVKVGEDYYCVSSGGMVIVDQTRWMSKVNNYPFTAGMYRFAADGKIIMTEEVVNEDGVYYYYNEGRRVENAGLVKVGEYYYCVSSGGKVIVSETRWMSKVNGYPFAAGMYRFDDMGRIIMTTDIVNEDGVLYYYKSGMRTANAGLVEYNGAYYYVGADAKVAVNTTVNVTASKTNGLKPAGVYCFGEDGTLQIFTGILEGYYYVDGVRTAAGLVEIDGSYYYAGSGGKLKMNETGWISNNMHGKLPAGTYRFDVDGRIMMEAAVVNEGGVYYYYNEGRRIDNAGLVKVGEYYYCVSSGGAVIVSQTRWVSKMNGYPFTAGMYTFDTEGHMVID